MWLSKSIRKRSSGAAASTASVSHGADRRVTAAGESGTGQYSSVLPAGVCSVPGKNEEAVIVETNSGRLCLGVKSPYHSFTAEPGEVALYSSGGAVIHLKNDGTIHIRGEIVYD